MKMMKKLVILNGAPNSGKDVIAEHFEGLGLNHVRFKTKLFEILLSMLPITKAEFFELYDNRETKERANPNTFNMSPREAMIYVSEEIMKPHFGDDYFGDAMARSLPDGMSICSDGGFLAETLVVANSLGAENVVVIRLHREGCNFDNDSRDHLYNTGCIEYDVVNDGTLPELFEKIMNIMVGEVRGDVQKV